MAVHPLVRRIGGFAAVPFIGAITPLLLLPVIALALVAGRRLGSSGLRVGSLSVDQFASVASVLATTYFFLQTVTDFHYGPLVALIGGLVMLTATVVAPFLPVLKDDFADRPETPAHRAARSITAAAAAVSGSVVPGRTSSTPIIRPLPRTSPTIWSWEVAFSRPSRSRVPTRSACCWRSCSST